MGNFMDIEVPLEIPLIADTHDDTNVVTDTTGVVTGSADITTPPIKKVKKTSNQKQEQNKEDVAVTDRGKKRKNKPTGEEVNKPPTKKAKNTNDAIVPPQPIEETVLTNPIGVSDDIIAFDTHEPLTISGVIADDHPLLLPSTIPLFGGASFGSIQLDAGQRISFDAGAATNVSAAPVPTTDEIRPADLNVRPHTCSIVFKHNDRYLFINENRVVQKYPVEKRADVWHPLGGKLEDTDPSPLLGAIREFVEETGYITDNHAAHIAELHKLVTQRPCTVLDNVYTNKQGRTTISRFFVRNVHAGSKLYRKLSNRTRFGGADIGKQLRCFPAAEPALNGCGDGGSSGNVGGSGSVGGADGTNRTSRVKWVRGPAQLTDRSTFLDIFLDKERQYLEKNIPEQKAFRRFLF